MAKTISYQLLDHTADCGIRVFARTQKELFENAALAMMDLIVPGPVNAGEKTRNISVSGIDMEDLLINFLREALYIFSGEGELVCSVSVDRLSGTSLSAVMETEKFSPDERGIDQDIKAVTYHNLEIVQTSRGWECSLIFDV